MRKNYIITIVSRYLIAVLNLVVVLLCSHYLGAGGLGFVSMFVLGIAINAQISSFFGGSALVYLTPRSNTANLLFISYSGAVLVHAMLIPLYFLVKPFDTEYFPVFFLISFINVLLSNNLSVLLGKQRVETYNIITTVQVLLQTLVFAGFVVIVHPLKTDHYVIAAATGYFMAFAGSSGVLYKEIRSVGESKLQTLKEILKYGFFSETGNILQLLSYRLNYFFVNKWLGMAALGEFSLAVQLTESLRIFSKGIATVEYSHYSNVKSALTTSANTKRSVLYSLAFTLTGLVALLLLPQRFISIIFGEEFPHIKTIIALLAPGILFLSAGTVIAPFFSGQGKHYINAVGSAICFAITAIFSFLLIPGFGLSGAATVSTMAYVAITVYLYLVYRKTVKIL